MYCYSLNQHNVMRLSLSLLTGGKFMLCLQDSDVKAKLVLLLC